MERGNAVAVKVPQIVKILRSGSAQGVSLVAHLIELAVYTISVTRSYNLQLPFRWRRPAQPSFSLSFSPAAAC
jgi:hypothetical protein